MTLSARVDFLLGDRTWFSDNPELAFRYHNVPPALALALLEAQGTPSDLPWIGEAESVCLLAYRAYPSDDVIYSAFTYPDDRSRPVYAPLCAENDEFGLWLSRSGAAIFPRPNREVVWMSGTRRNLLGEFLTAA